MFQKQHELAARTRGQLFRDEMSQTVNHAMRAAGHAAGGMRAARSQMAPAAHRARLAASRRWAEFNEAAAVAGRAPRRAARGRRAPRPDTGMPRLAGLIASGAAVGMAVAMMVRRRRQQQWEEYEAARMMEPAGREPAGADIGGMPPESPPAVADPGTAAMESGEADIDEELTGRRAGPRPPG